MSTYPLEVQNLLMGSEIGLKSRGGVVMCRGGWKMGRFLGRKWGGGSLRVLGQWNVLLANDCFHLVLGFVPFLYLLFGREGVMSHGTPGFRLQLGLELM